MTITLKTNFADQETRVHAVEIRVTEETAGIVKDVVQLGARVAIQNAPKDTSGLARAIGGESRGLVGSVVVPMGSTSVGIGQAITMEEGRTPGKKMPPPFALYDWANRHGFDLKGVDPGNPKKTGVLFVLARSIGRKGIEGKHYMAAARAEMERALPGLAVQALRRMVGH